jgi:hypothetical protein
MGVDNRIAKVNHLSGYAVDKNHSITDKTK